MDTGGWATMHKLVNDDEHELEQDGRARKEEKDGGGEATLKIRSRTI